MNNNDLVAKLWKLCDNLRDGGVSYQNYVNELASLLFLKMCEETGQEDELLPEGYRWADLKAKLGQEQHQFYRNMLVQLGADDHAIVRAIFQNVNTTITQPAQLTELVDNMDKLEWFDGDTGKSVMTLVTCTKVYCKRTRTRRNQVRVSTLHRVHLSAPSLK